MSDIFISYSSKDRPWVKAFAECLQSEGWSVWWDREIATGRNFYRVLEEELDRARCVVVVWSENSIHSDWVPNEAEEGLKRNILIPVAIGTSTPPLVFRHLQTADLSNWTGDRSALEYRKVAGDIASLLGATGAKEEKPREAQPAPPPPGRKDKEKPGGRGPGTWVAVALAIVGLVVAAYLGGEHLLGSKPEILSFQIIPTSSVAGEPVTLWWQTRNASAVELEGIGPVPLEGKHMARPRQTRAYTLIARDNRGRSVSSTIQVAVRGRLPGHGADRPDGGGDQEGGVSQPAGPPPVPEAAQGKTVRGRILYNGDVITRVTNAKATVQLRDAQQGYRVVAESSYDNKTGEYTINNVPPGKFGPSVVVQSGHPFDVMAGGDYISYLSGLNPDIVVSPESDVTLRDLVVVQSIHLTGPVDNQELRTNVGDPPERLHQNFFAPSAEVFEWEPVPGAASYEVTFLLNSGERSQVLDRRTNRVATTRFSPRLPVTSGNTFWSFRVEARNERNELIGHFSNYYRNGFGGWFDFVVLPGR